MSESSKPTSQITDPLAEYRGPEADARAARIDATLGTDAETLVDTVWLLRYTTVKHKKLPRLRRGVQIV